MRIMMTRKLLFVGLLILLTACTAGALTTLAVCNVQLTEIDVPQQSIESWVGTSDYTVQDLIRAAKNAVAQDVGAIGSTHISFVVAAFMCEGHNCQLRQLNLNITATRNINCPELFETSPEYNTLTEFLFDTTSDSIHAQTQPVGIQTLEAIEWEALPVNLEEAQRIAIAAGDAFVLEHSQYELNVIRTRPYWTVDFYSDLTGQQQMPDIEFHIDYVTGEVLNTSDGNGES